MSGPATFRRLLTGLDTVQAAYYLVPRPGAEFSFAELLADRERLRASKRRASLVREIGGVSFFLRPYGSGSGYPLVLENRDFTIECGEFNNPSFFVTFRSETLWQRGAEALHATFLAWAESVGLAVLRPERLSRVDFTFDYELTGEAIAPDQVVSLSAKDDVYRKDRTVQTLRYGRGDVVLRIYDKVAEILEKSEKIWFFDLWGVQENVWRIEWQVRKPILRRFGIRTFVDLFANQADVLRYLATEHDTLRVPTNDSNRSRWPLHPLWADLLAQIETFQGQGLYREVDEAALLNERLRRLAISVYGYAKRVGAILSLQSQRDEVALGEALRHMDTLVRDIHDPMTWALDVRRKRDEMRLGDG